MLVRRLHITRHDAVRSMSPFTSVCAYFLSMQRVRGEGKGVSISEEGGRRSEGCGGQ